MLVFLYSSNKKSVLVWECKSLPDTTLKEAKYAPWKGSITLLKPKKWQLRKRQSGNGIDLAMFYPHKCNASYIWGTDNVDKPLCVKECSIVLACWETIAAGTIWHWATRKGVVLYEQRHWPWFKKAGMQTMLGSVESSYSSELKDKIYPFG